MTGEIAGLAKPVSTSGVGAHVASVRRVEPFVSGETVGPAKSLRTSFERAEVRPFSRVDPLVTGEMAGGGESVSTSGVGAHVGSSHRNQISGGVRHDDDCCRRLDVYYTLPV